MPTTSTALSLNIRYAKQKAERRSKKMMMRENQGQEMKKNFKSSKNKFINLISK
jgi:hypothetical protein